jgi:hypothetical protein
MFYWLQLVYGFMNHYSFPPSLPLLSNSVSELRSLGKYTALLGIWLHTLCMNVMLSYSRIENAEMNARQNQLKAIYRYSDIGYG